MQRLKPEQVCESLVFGFTDRRCNGSRSNNDQIFKKFGFDIFDFASNEEKGVSKKLENCITTLVASRKHIPMEVHIDYSSMPRRWYCALFQTAHKCLRKCDSLYMWYSGGLYTNEEYPTAGISDFSLFSGQPTITPKVRTHLFGLGFDRIRASAIFRVVDPQNLVCFYGEPGVKSEYVKRVKTDNRDILAAAQYEFSVPVDNFTVAFSKIADVVRDYAQIGDVILVPDGPKPLVLASSLIPYLFERRGIVSLHVRQRKEQQSSALDVHASGSIYGFSVAGAHEQ